MSNWQTILERHGITTDETASSLGDVRSETESADRGECIAPLANIVIYAISGGDSRDFLQGQLSNDVRLVDAEHSQLSSYNSPKGRMMASFRLLQRDDELLMLLPADIAEAAIARLKMFVLRSDVTIEPRDNLLAVGVSGSGAVDKLGTPLPAQVDGVVTTNALTLIRVADNGQPRCVVIAPVDEMAGLWQQLTAAGVSPVGTDGWQLQDIRAGLPSLASGTRESFVPQMLNYHLINGVHFKKGCYPGQEVVARMQYLGKLKRRMYRARVNSETRPQPGDELHSPSSTSSQGAGNVVMAAPAANGSYELLAVLDVKTMESGPLHLDNDNGPVVEILDLPYSFEEQERA